MKLKRNRVLEMLAAEHRSAWPRGAAFVEPPMIHWWKQKCPSEQRNMNDHEGHPVWFGFLCGPLLLLCELHLP